MANKIITISKTERTRIRRTRKSQKKRRRRKAFNRKRKRKTYKRK